MFWEVEFSERILGEFCADGIDVRLNDNRIFNLFNHGGTKRSANNSSTWLEPDGADNLDSNAGLLDFDDMDEEHVSEPELDDEELALFWLGEGGDEPVDPPVPDPMVKWEADKFFSAMAVPGYCGFSDDQKRASTCVWCKGRIEKATPRLHLRLRATQIEKYMHSES